jgi:hypothetical protein
MASKILEGISRNGVGIMHILADVPDAFINGAPVSAIGQLCTDDEGTISHYSRGLPLSATGRLVTLGVDRAYNLNGWPFAVTGEIAIGAGPVTQHVNAIPLNAAGQLVTTVDAPT